MILTERDLVVLSAYTGISMTESFLPIQQYIEEKLRDSGEKYSFYHPEIMEEIRKRTRDDFKNVLSHLTVKQRIVFTAYTGVSMTGDFNAVHGYIEEKLGRTVYSHEFATDPVIMDEIREKTREDFLEEIRS